MRAKLIRCVTAISPTVWTSTVTDITAVPNARFSVMANSCAVFAETSGSKCRALRPVAHRKVPFCCGAFGGGWIRPPPLRSPLVRGKVYQLALPLQRKHRQQSSSFSFAGCRPSRIASIKDRLDDPRAAVLLCLGDSFVSGIFPGHGLRNLRTRATGRLRGFRRSGGPYSYCAIRADPRLRLQQVKHRAKEPSS